MNQTFKSTIAESRKALDAHILSWLEESAWPEDFQWAAKHCMYEAGKAFRPALYFGLLKDFSFGDVYTNGANLNCALSLELLHTYSLIHDDLPAMDDDAWRRSKPTLHTLKGDAFAILAGDALLTEAFGRLAISFQDSPEKVSTAISILSRASGAKGMIDGQWLDISSTQGGNKVTVSQLETLHRQKTGALLGAVSALAALSHLSLAEFRESRESFESWGQDLGLLFQIKDDLLDLAPSSVTGKSSGKDSAQGKITFASLMSAAEILDRINKLENHLIGNRPSGVTEDFARGLVEFVSQRSS